MANSIVEYFAEHENYKCGYCKKTDTNFAHGMWAHTMSVEDYQALIDRGWRRSGKYCYKPTLNIICCPMYTIRCRALEFKATKSQKKVLKRFNKYLMGEEEVLGKSNRKLSESSDDMKLDYCGGGDEFVESKQKPQELSFEGVIKYIDDQSTDPSVNEIENLTPGPMCASSSKELSASTTKEIKKGSGPDPTKMPCRKAKDIRKERKLEKLKAQGKDITILESKANTNEKDFELFIKELPAETKHRLEIRLVRTQPPSEQWLRTAKEVHRVYVKYQMTVHGDTEDKCTEDKFQEFLVHSPLVEEYTSRGPACGFGSFQQQYCLDGRIIAVGVIDILPKCISSVYFFYDPEYRNLNLGTYGALRELEFTRHLHTQSADLKYYYMGYYIHSCPKMRYKGRFSPSDLLCPETYKWFPLNDCLPKLEASPYSRLNPDLDALDDNYPNSRDINHIQVLYKGSVWLFGAYKRKHLRNIEKIAAVMEYASLVGARAATSIVLIGSTKRFI
ncbi:arginyl-tRNA--protein transferase 1 isoform X2 [Leptidea sinapis]|uniref:arginyl-tRNA--protein transferase 1 isoform X2 n=1 Tax=Leptidea sinapis TaxID=189913 RepID=UPI0021C2E8F0|nr:arginyl-tRNA--protein transferase 1 isoform X2 [Leptidea sinapis]